MASAALPTVACLKHESPTGNPYQNGCELCEMPRNVVDGPIMWKLEAPAGYTSGLLVRLNEIALIPAVLVFLRHGGCPVRLPLMSQFDAGSCYMSVHVISLCLHSGPGGGQHFLFAGRSGTRQPVLVDPKLLFRHS